MGYSMKMGSKENYSPTAFKTKDLAMLMHNPGHKDKTITNVSYSVNKQKLPAKANEYPGYGGTKTTRTMTTTSSTSGSPSKGSDEFNFTFAQARKKGLETFPFKGKIYTTELAKPKKSVKTITFTGETGGLKKLNLQGPSANTLLDPIKPPTIPTTNKIIPPKNKIKKKKKRKKLNLRLRLGEIQLPRIQLPSLRLGLGGGCKGYGCPNRRAQILKIIRRKRGRR
jgi:hypothetical protein